MITEERRLELVSIANKLTNEDLVQLVYMLRDRIFVVKFEGNTAYTSSLDDECPACLNGASVQLNIQGED